MTSHQIVAPCPTAIRHIAENIEPADADELRACTGADVLGVLEDSVRDSYVCFVSVLDGEPAAIYGIAMAPGYDGVVGVPWAVFTPHCRRYPRVIMETASGFIESWKQRHQCLTNAVDVRNTRAIRWLEKLGFEFVNEYPVADTTFMQFFWSAHDDV